MGLESERGAVTSDRFLRLFHTAALPSARVQKGIKAAINGATQQKQALQKPGYLTL